MKTVILFGGGDDGGLIITEHGVRPIPPFDPGVLLTLKSASAMVNSLSLTHNVRSRGKKAKLATSLSNLAVEQVENIIGSLEGDHSLIFQDDDGGFYCGSTGKPPIPLPWPPKGLPSLAELMSAGVIENDLVELFQAAKAKNVSYTRVLEDPADIALELGIRVSEKTVADLKILAPSKLSVIKDQIDREIIGFFHKVADDGKHLDIWLEHPVEVANELNITLSEAALERIISKGAAAAFGTRGGENAFADIGVCVAVVTGADVIIIAVVALSSRPIDDIIKDRSGIIKI